MIFDRPAFWIATLIFCVVLFIAFAFTVSMLSTSKSCEQDFEDMTREYQHYASLYKDTLTDEELNTTLLRQFAPTKDGRCVVLIERNGKKSVAIWSAELVAKVMAEGKAHRAEYLFNGK